MNTNNLQSLIFGNTNQADILKLVGSMLNGSNKGINPLTMVQKNLTQIIVNECQNEVLDAAFINDPRRSDKEKAIINILSQSMPVILSKMSERDVSDLYSSLKQQKELKDEK